MFHSELAGVDEPLLRIDDFTSEANGFTRIDWYRYWDALQDEGLSVATSWEAAKHQWCRHISQDLGGDARLRAAPNVIQSFWAGTSFSEPSDACDLSYVLAELLVTNLSEDWGTFIGFLAAAHYDDGGQTAALDHLGVCLGTAAGAFLGEGFYRPVRKELVRCWSEGEA